MTPERFRSRLALKESCLIWEGALDSGGYGHFTGRDGKPVRAHRYAYELANGPIPAKDGHHPWFVLHSCDNRACCNADHLRLGSHAENMAEMVERGRSVRHPGEENGRSVLTPDQVAAIRADPRGTRTIAKDYPVQRCAIQRIKSGKAWAHV